MQRPRGKFFLCVPYQLKWSFGRKRARCYLPIRRMHRITSIDCIDLRFVVPEYVKTMEYGFYRWG